jgi:phosphoribosylamine--glycine ligase
MSTAPTRTLIVGSGAREHALAWKLAGEPGMNEVVVAPGSAAIGAEPRVRCVPVDPLDGAAVVAAARGASAELVVIGPEAPLAAGLSDALQDAGMRVFGPSRAAAEIEISKSFCHDVAEAAGVPMARARAFAHGEEAAARSFVAELGTDGRGVVLKQDGLAAGKGVTVYDDAGLALDHVPSYLEGRGEGPALVVEERLTGLEASVIAVCDGREAIALPASRDHKRLCDGDTGPNTGGMGAYSPLPDLPYEEVATVLDTFHRPILAELARRGRPFIGFLYAGLMLTDNGPVLLECNARLGDPEAQVILPRIGGDFARLMQALGDGRLAAYAHTHPLRFSQRAYVDVALCAEGYPGQPRVGDPVTIGDLPDDAWTFHAGTRRAPNGGFVTAGGRVMHVVAQGDTTPHAREKAYRAAERIEWKGRFYRSDIAASEGRVEMTA